MLHKEYIIRLWMKVPESWTEKDIEIELKTKVPSITDIEDIDYRMVDE